MINFIGQYKFWYGVSAVLVLLGVIAMIAYGLNFGIDFRGGTLTQMKFIEEQPQAEDVRNILAAAGFGDALVQPADEQSVIIRTGPMEKEDHDRMLAVLREEFGELEEEQFTSIGPVIGRELRSKAVLQLVLVTLGIILYIAYAFRRVTRPVSSWRFGFAAIVALIHDLIIVVGVFAILGRFLNVEIDTLFVTALLTVLGFSVHDTIVVFDRIRENLRVSAGSSLSEIINSSINQTLIRSINTTLTVIFVLLALLLFGGETIRYFVLALMIGVTAGTYSSIFIASPMLLTWYNWDMKRRSA